MKNFFLLYGPKTTSNPYLMRRFFLFLMVFCQALVLVSQNTTDAGLKNKPKQLVSSEYNRNSLTILNLGFPGKYSPEISETVGRLKVPDKYFDNTLSYSVIPVESTRESGNKVNDIKKMLDPGFVTDALIRAKTGQMIIAKWFDRDQDGKFNINQLKERGLYNASDNAMIIAEAGKRGTASLMDMGMGLVDKSYVLVVDIPELMSMEEIYNRDTIPAAKRVFNGFSGKLNSYLYKLDFNEEQAALFFQDMWISGNAADNLQRKALFEKTNFPLIYLNAFSTDVMATQLNPDQKLAPKVQKTPAELLTMFLETGVQQSLYQIEKTNESFRVKAMIYKTRPIAVKIGRKEGLKFDQRYFVYENRQNRKGQTYSVRKGVIKAMSVVNNLQEATGETAPSLFYQVAGKKIDNMGMFVEQKNALGLNLFVGAATGYIDGSLPGITGRLEFCISPVLYEAFVKKGKSWFLKSLKLYTEGGYMQENYLDDYGFLRYSFGISKEMFLTRNVFIEPFAGYGFEEAKATEGNTEEKIASQFIEYGGHLGINLSPGWQLMGSVNNFSIMDCKLNAGPGTTPDPVNYNFYFDGRKGPNYSIGFRFTF
jgi:hypothetical protein